MHVQDTYNIHLQSSTCYMLSEFKLNMFQENAFMVHNFPLHAFIF